jgi:two-component system response regulator PilR (NtrC family)
MMLKPEPNMNKESEINENDLELETRIIPNHYNVLIVEDEPRVLEILVQHMHELNHLNFQTCSSVTEVKNKTKNNKFDLFLLDWNLSDGTCIDLIDHIRAEEKSRSFNQSVIMVVTGRDSVDDIMTLVHMNVTDQLIKPFDHSEFKEKISYALEKHNKAA